MNTNFLKRCKEEYSYWANSKWDDLPPVFALLNIFKLEGKDDLGLK